MYAVIETGGKQYRVEVGTELEVELLAAGPGDAIAFERVLLVADGDTASIGRPIVANASVSAEVLRRDRGEKLISFKYRPKARRRVKKGHRQELTVVRISDIVLDGKSAASDLAEEEAKRQTERKRLQEAARRQAEQDAALAAKLAADAAAAEEPAKAEKAAAKPVALAQKAAAAKASSAKASSAKAEAKAETTKAGTTKAETTKATAKPKGKAATTDTTDKGAAKASPATKATGAPRAPRARKSDKD
jgi:large subunit ribosomal protein L21